MTDGDADSASPWPASILLAQHAYVAASRNDTTATARSRSTGNHTVEVTFWMADPPAVSFYTCHCSNSKGADLKVQPEVVGAQGRLVLLRVVFASGYYNYNKDEEEYFIYTGDPRSPSLESIPLPDDDDRRRLGKVGEFGIVPRGGGHYLLVALRSAAATNFKDYRLHIYSSEERTWRSKEVANPCPGEYAIWPDKVITVGDGVLAWVGFQQGMVVCDVLHQEDQEPLHARYIPLPAPLPENRQDTFLKQLRDVACGVDGLIKFVEVEPRVIVTETREEPLLDPRDKDVLYDSDLIASSKHALIKPKIMRTMDGWSAMTWTRELGSDCWRRGSVVDVDDISVDDAASSALLSGQGNDDEATGRLLPFRNLHSAWPILCVDGDDILYLKLSRHLTHSSRWVVAVDLAKKTLKRVEAPGELPFGGWALSQQILSPCALPNHLKMTPGIKVSAINTTKTGSSANEPNNTSICVAEPDSYKFKNKRPRLSPAEKANHAQDGAHSAAQNDLSSQAHSDQNNKRKLESSRMCHFQPPQICFNRWTEPGYGGYSSWSWPHQNILPPPPPPLPSPQCFNGWAGPFCNPMYAPRAPGPDMCSYDNYQPPWQQPLPQEQQTTASIAFGPHQAPCPSFNNWWGTSYHGSSQQRPAGNSYANGAHAGNANYHQR